MLQKNEALKILKEEYNYEESIVEDLTVTYLASLRRIKDLSEGEIKELEKQLALIRDESSIHRDVFEKLMEFVKENDGADKY